MWHQSHENVSMVLGRFVFSARLKVLSDKSGDRSADDRRFHVAGPLTAKLRCPVAVRARGSSRVVKQRKRVGKWNKQTNKHS